MPKGRHLKPEFFTDKHIVSASPLARLLYQGLWCYAADCGHLDDEPIELKMRILPGDNCDVDDLLAELTDCGRIERKDGVIYLPKLRDHARVDKRYETLCEACKEAAKHGVTTTGDAALSTPHTTGSLRDHDVTTQGSQRDHDADGDGDGDGEVMVKGAPSARRATQIPASWQPNEAHAAYAAEQRINVDLERDKFRDWAKAGGKSFKDWDAAFRNWLRNSLKYRTPEESKPPRVLPTAAQVEEPPDGLTPKQYRDWHAGQRAKRQRA